MNRRQFLKALGVSAAAVQFGGGLSAPTIETPAWDALALHAGDVFTIAGKYAVNPVTGSETAFLQHFIVTHTVTADDADAEISIHPAINGIQTIHARDVDLLGATA